MKDHIRYDILAQDALRGVIRKVLSEVAATGSLPGDHHFFITFLTNAPGVRISAHLKEKYAEQMTIVIQHQFWELEVGDTSFSVSLSFNGVPERLTVPFAAIKGFLDPSVQFGLQFDPGTPVEANDAEAPAADAPAADALSAAPQPADDTSVPEKPAKTKKAKSEKTAAQASGEASDAASEASEDDSQGAEVVSLDTFRKKH